MNDNFSAVSFWLVCALHEAGHIIAVKLTGGEIRKIEFSFFGIVMTAAPPVSVKKGTAVLLSGPAVNFLIWAILLLNGKNGLFCQLNLAACVFNMLPLSFLDGGGITALLTEGNPFEREIRPLMILIQLSAVIAYIIFML